MNSMFWSEAEESRLKELTKRFKGKKTSDESSYLELLALKLKKQRIDRVNSQPD